MFNVRHGDSPDGTKDAGSCPEAVVSIRPIKSDKTNSPCARQHDNLGLFDSFGNEVFDDLADDQGSHEGVLSW